MAVGQKEIQHIGTHAQEVLGKSDKDKVGLSNGDKCFTVDFSERFASSMVTNNNKQL